MWPFYESDCPHCGWDRKHDLDCQFSHLKCDHPTEACGPNGVMGDDFCFRCRYYTRRVNSGDNHV